MYNELRNNELPAITNHTQWTTFSQYQQFTADGRARQYVEPNPADCLIDCLAGVEL
jgi:hypothetical protein